MNQLSQRAKSIFLEAIELPDFGQCGAFVAAACRNDAELRHEVERLLRNYGKLGSFMQSDVQDTPTCDPPPLEKPGTQIGPYKLLQQIGEGGMGVVYMAEQTEPVRRKVALKIIKPGMDTRQVIARFEAERQALSLMDHPNIARVLDAGTTDSGRPYFVMELVKGQPITEYCDEHHLTPRERLELLLPVCQAIQHAHQKGIIHRDIKPSNILVAEYDQQAVPKVIDFGVAKAISQPLTEKTMFTGYGQIVGTLEYMSPEQAKVNQLDIDTRSDIYSLGVLMYELLTGTTPFDKRRLRSAAYDELLRIIREEEPPKPSTRLSESKDSLPSVSAQRQTEPAKLTKLLRGELDWIVMKALEKDRARRYETANGLASDIQRYLNDEPVVACPPSAAYRLRKFARRNKAALATASILAVALLAGLAGTSWQAFRATRAERRAQANEHQALANERQATASAKAETEQRIRAEAAAGAERLAKQAEADQRRKAEASFAQARAAVDDYLTKVTESQLLSAPGLQPLRRDLLDSALKFYDEFLKRRDDPALRAAKAGVYLKVGKILAELGDKTAAQQSFEAAVQVCEELVQRAPEDPNFQQALLEALYAAKQYERAIEAGERLLKLHPERQDTRRSLADAYNGRFATAADAEENNQTVQDLLRSVHLREELIRSDPGNADYEIGLSLALNNLGAMFPVYGLHWESLPLLRRAYVHSRRALASQPNNYNAGRLSLAYLQNLNSKEAGIIFDEAAGESSREGWALSRQLARTNRDVPIFAEFRALFATRRGAWLAEHGQVPDAIVCYREAFELLQDATLERSLQTRLQGPAIVVELANLLAQQEKATDTLTRRTESERAADEALTYLIRWIEDGKAFNLNEFKSNPETRILRDRPDFETLVKRIEGSQLHPTSPGSADHVPAADDSGESIASLDAEILSRGDLAAVRYAEGLIQFLSLNQPAAARASLDAALREQQALARDDPTSG